MATAQSSSIPPATAEYGGDEISALVLDPGYATVRAGFAGEDVPKSVVPSHYGVVDDASSGSGTKLLFGDNSVHAPLPGLGIKNPMAEDSTVQDWDVAKQIWEYAITSRLTNIKSSNPAVSGRNGSGDVDMEVEMDALADKEKLLEEHPLLMSEPSWNPARARERSVEMAMEDWGCPAFWTASSSVLSAFSAGKSSALVVDIGASVLSVTPVHDGLMLKKGIQMSNLAGNFISQQIRMLFSACQPPVHLTPHYLVSSKTPVDAGAPANATYRSFAKPPQESFRRLEEERVLSDFKESVVQIWGGPGRLSGGQQGTPNEEVVRAMPGRPFEMPDGWNQVFGPERFRVAEGIYDAKMAFYNSEHPQPPASATLPIMVQESLNAVDPDIRPHLLNNVVFTGGASLIHGFGERLNTELVQIYPGPRVRVSAPGSHVERKFGSWIGGSILGSLGTFHQMWISRKEYEEHGTNIVEKRCK